jgi:hypothetical protein
MPIVAVNLLVSLLAEVVGTLSVAFAGSGVALLALTQFDRVVYGGLLAGQAPLPADLSRPDARSWSLLGHFIAASLLAASPLLAAIVLTSLAAVFEPMTVVLLLAWPFGIAMSVFLMARLALVPPFAVEPQPGGAFATSWRLTRGRFGLVFGVILVTVAPFALADGIVRFALLGIGEPGLGVALIGGLVSGVLNLAMIAVSSHALVELARALTAAAGAAPHSGPGGPSA